MPKGIGVYMTLKQKTPNNTKVTEKPTSDFNFVLYVGQIWLMCTSSALFVLKNEKKLLYNSLWLSTCEWIPR